MIVLTSAEVAELKRLRHLGVGRVLRTLEAKGILKRQDGQGSRAAIDPSMIAPKDVAFFLSAVDRVRRTLATRDDDTWDNLKRSIYGVRKNAIRRGLTFDLSIDDLRKLYERSAGQCEVTGVPFSL